MQTLLMRVCQFFHSKAQLAGNGFPFSRVVTQLWKKCRATAGAINKSATDVYQKGAT